MQMLATHPRIGIFSPSGILMIVALFTCRYLSKLTMNDQAFIRLSKAICFHQKYVSEYSLPYLDQNI